MQRRHTKIVATLGPASEDDAVLDQLLAAGVDCFRINCSHGTEEDLRRRTAAARAAAARANRAVGVLFDLQGPKLRLHASTPEEMFTVGAEVVFVGSGTADRTPDEVLVDFGPFAQLATERSEIVIGDGVPRFEVTVIDGERVRARAVSRGLIGPRKGINITYARPHLPAITDKDAADLLLAAELRADFVALSFVRSAADVVDLRDRLRDAGSLARTVAKIEKVEAYDRLDEILAVADGVMVARGDYGVEAGVARVPLMQKDTIRRANQAGKLVITATQMLESMIHAPEPTRAEATDVANAVMDGTSAVMLSAETGVGEFPVQAVLAMSEIAVHAEASRIVHGRAQWVPPATAAETVLYAAVQLAEALDGAALIVPTATGGSARACSKYRPPQPILALAHDATVANQLTLEWGVVPIPALVAENVDDLVEDSLLAARDTSGLLPGQTVVLTAGRRTATPGATSLIMVREIP